MALFVFRQLVLKATCIHRRLLIVTQPATSITSILEFLFLLFGGGLINHGTHPKALAEVSD